MNEEYKENNNTGQWNQKLVLWKYKVDKPSVWLVKRSKEKIQVNKIRNERWAVTTDITDIFHQSSVMCKKDVLWKEEGKLVMSRQPRIHQSLLICCSLFLWNFKNFRGIEEYLHAIATALIWIVNFLKNTQFFFKLSNSRWSLF